LHVVVVGAVQLAVVPAVHVVRHAVWVPLQVRPLPQVLCVPGVHEPEPLHVPGVSVEPVHESQDEVGPRQAPVLVQLVAPQVPVVLHADEQQKLPPRHEPLAHIAWLEQAWPPTSRQLLPPTQV
jgi:hypothetical protein